LRALHILQSLAVQVAIPRQRHDSAAVKPRQSQEMIKQSREHFGVMKFSAVHDLVPRRWSKFASIKAARRIWKVWTENAAKHGVRGNIIEIPKQVPQEFSACL
jgi:hypothetical protein